MHKKYLMGLLMAPAADGSGGGGGAPALTMEAVATEIDKRVTAGVTAALDKFRTTGLGSAIEEKIAPLSTSLAGITESLAKLTGGQGSGQGSGQGGGQGGGNGQQQVPPELNVKLNQLLETTKNQGVQIETLKKERQEAEERAERSDRHSVIRAALNNMHFIGDTAAQTAFTIVEPHIKRLDDNSLIGAVPNGDNFPVDAFVKDYLQKEHGYLLRSTGSQGSGAQSMGGTGVRMGVKADISDIKPGMKAETRDSVVASIAAALQSQ